MCCANTTGVVKGPILAPKECESTCMNHCHYITWVQIGPSYGGHFVKGGGGDMLN